MANQRKVGLKIEIDGEKEYKQAINEINKGNQVLASELKLVSEQFKGNEDSIEALNAKGDVLRRQLQQQEDKVKTLRAALQNAATQYGEADKRTQEWQVQLNNAETQEIKLRRALDETNKEIEQQGSDSQAAGQKMATLGDQVAGIADKFGLRLPESIKGALDHVDGFSTGTIAAMGAAAAGIAAGMIASGIILRASNDQYINTTFKRVPIHVDNDSGRGGGGWSGGTTIDSGGFSGHSGKF